MRIALVGWDFEDEIASELSGLGVQLVGITRRAAHQPEREDRGGWDLIRFPHAAGGTARDEASAFAVAVAKGAAAAGVGPEFDVVHALDLGARGAAAALARHVSGRVQVASFRLVDAVEFEQQGGAAASQDVDGWICDHPWGAGRLGERLDGLRPISVVLSRQAVAPSPCTDPGPSAEQGGGDPTMVVSLARDGEISADVLGAAITLARDWIPGLSVTILGAGERAAEWIRAMRVAGLLADGPGVVAASTPSRWDAAVRGALVVAVETPAPVDDPTASLAWIAGRPVIRLIGADAPSLARWVCDAVRNPGRYEREARAGAALAWRKLAPAAVAQAWLRSYLEIEDRVFGPGSIAAASRGHAGQSAGRPLRFPELRSRLTLTPLSSREVLASCALRPDDWRRALEWLGLDATRAVVTIRLFDITDISFNGANAHGSWDVDLAYGEDQRTIAISAAGRSLAACLGVRSSSGYFHAIAHGRICHLPREEFAPALPVRRLRVMPGRPSPRGLN